MGAATGAVRAEVGFVVFPGVQQLDLTGPYEVLASAAGVRVHLIGCDATPVMSSTGLIFHPTVMLAACPPLDVLCVPGGVGVGALMEDEAFLAALTALALRSRFVTAVCTGALVLGAAGLLRGRRATTHWNAHDFLAAFGAEPVPARVVRDGNVITSAGVTSGIDFAFTLVAELFGAAEAQAVQLAMEYAPEPPFSAGTPQTAPAEVLARTEARFATMRADRAALVSRLSGRAGD